MSYVTTGSSNTVTSGSPLHLNIRILRDPKEAIFLMGTFTIIGLSEIATGESLRKMTCVLSGVLVDADNDSDSGKIVAFPYDDSNPGQRSITLNREDKRQYTHLDLKIEATTATMATLSTHLTLTFYDKNNTDNSGKPILNTIDFEVHKIQTPLKIVSFTASRLVLQGGDKPVTLHWKIKGDNYTYRLLKGLTVLKTGSKSDTEQEFSTIPTIGDHVFTLEVTQDGKVVTKDIKIRALGKSEISTVANPIDSEIVNFCASKDATSLFGLMFVENDNKTHIDHIGYNTEGFSSHWRRLELTTTDKDQLKPFATSPMIHLKNTGDVFGRVLFIGGSYIKPFACANTVAIVDLDKEGDKVTVISNLKWDARMGHSCTLFPHGDAVEKIWLMGGVDEYGNALNDVWVSGDGVLWENVNATGTKNTKNVPAAMPWDARCLAGITTQLDDQGNKKALWFGGGFTEIGGTETKDIWVFEKGKWTQLHSSNIAPFSINNGTYLSSGLGFIGIDARDIGATGVAIMGGYQYKNESKNGYFNKIEIQPNGSFTASNAVVSAQTDIFNTIDDAYVVTAFFKGSLWFMVYTNAGDRGIIYSPLHFWIPVVTTRTLILS